MLLGLALAMAAPEPQQTFERPAAPAIAQARASVRIIAGASIRFAGGAASDGPPPRDSTIRSDGMSIPAKLVEFE